MQCSACKEIMPYEHDGTSHVCGAKKAGVSEAPAEDDVINAGRENSMMRVPRTVLLSAATGPVPIALSG